MTKQERMWEMLKQVENILRIQNPEKAEKWALSYVRTNEHNINDFTPWQREYHMIRLGEEYLLIWERPESPTGTPTLLYSLNVTGEKETYAIGRLMQLIGDKF